MDESYDTAQTGPQTSQDISSNVRPTEVPNLSDNNSQPVPSNEKYIRAKSLLLFLANFVILPPFAVLAWLSMMSQYKLSLFTKISIFMVSGLVGPILLLVGSGGETGDFNYAYIITGALITATPSIYSFFVPRTRTAV